MAIVMVSLHSSCAPALWSPAREQYSESVYTELQKGRSTYVGHCGACHNLPLPERKNASEWAVYVEKMGARAHLDPDQKKSIYQYLMEAVAQK